MWMLHMYVNVYVVRTYISCEMYPTCAYLLHHHTKLATYSRQYLCIGADSIMVHIIRSFSIDTDSTKHRTPLQQLNAMKAKYSGLELVFKLMSVAQGCSWDHDQTVTGWPVVTPYTNMYSMPC